MQKVIPKKNSLIKNGGIHNSLASSKRNNLLSNKYFIARYDEWFWDLLERKKRCLQQEKQRGQSLKIVFSLKESFNRFRRY